MLVLQDYHYYVRSDGKLCEFEAKIQTCKDLTVIKIAALLFLRLCASAMVKLQRYIAFINCLPQGIVQRHYLLSFLEEWPCGSFA